MKLLPGDTHEWKEIKDGDIRIHHEYHCARCNTTVEILRSITGYVAVFHGHERPGGGATPEKALRKVGLVPDCSIQLVRNIHES